MKHWFSFSLFVAVFCGGAAVYYAIRAAMGGGWVFVLAALGEVGLAALNFYFFKSTRKAKKTVATNPQYHSGGYITSAEISKMFRDAARVASTPIPARVAAPPKPAQFHGLPFEFAVGEVYGLRMWHMDQYGRLRARNWEGAPPWRPGVNVAKCVKRKLESVSAGAYRVPTGGFEFVVDDNPGHDVPSEGCSCGFYAYTDNLHAEVKSHARNGEEPVLGIIKGTGKTLIGTQGFRCEKAEIVAFRDPTRGGAKNDEWRKRQLANLRRVYLDVPILDNRAALLEFAPLTDTLPDVTSDEFWALP